VQETAESLVTSSFGKFYRMLLGKGAKRQSGDQDGEAIAQQMRPTRRSPALTQYPRFRSTASDQFEFKQTDGLSGVRLRLRSVFTPSQPITDRRAFAGRASILTSLIQALEDFRLHIVLYGERGLGKTSVLHVLSQAARDARYLMIYMPCGAGSNFDEVFRAIASSIPLLYHGGVDPTSSRSEVGQTLADLLPAGSLSPRTASDLLAKVVGTRVIVVLDEFDRCESKEFRLSIAELLKNLSDRSVRVQLVIAGVAANLTELIDYIPSIQRNIYALQLPRMNAAEVRELVKNGETITGLRFDDAAVTGLVSVSNGFPYFASLLSHYASLKALEDSRVVVTRGDLLAALRSAVTDSENRVSKTARLQIEAIVAEGQLQLLGMLAGAAQMSGGQFELNEVRSLLPESAARVERLIDTLSKRQTVIELSEDAPTPSYRFLDEGSVPYIWLLAAEARLRDVATLRPVNPSAPAQSLPRPAQLLQKDSAKP